MPLIIPNAKSTSTQNHCSSYRAVAYGLRRTQLIELKSKPTFRKHTLLKEKTNGLFSQGAELGRELGLTECWSDIPTDLDED